MATQQPRKRSFFERLTGSIRMEDDEPVATTPVRKTNLYNNRYEEEYQDDETVESSLEIVSQEEDIEEDAGEAQLAVDVYETNDALIVKTMTAGVKKEDLQITVARELLTIKGRRENDARTYSHHYHNQELFWGAFSRTIELPEEVDIEQATATEHHGLITIKLPKFDKKRQTTLKIQ